MNKTNLSAILEELFNNNTDYTNPMQAVNQADSIAALSVDLYTDANRFIYELLQNADDSPSDNGVSVWIKLFNDKLVVAHSGRAFDERDIRGICNINNGTKKSDLKKTGYKGIGFKSVFGQSNNVVIYTGGEYFRFDSSYNFGWKWEKETTQSEWEIRNDKKFQYPWQIIPIISESTQIAAEIRNYISKIGANVVTILQINHLDETKLAIENLSKNINMFLFLKNVTQISFDGNCITIDRSNTNKIILNKSKPTQIQWLMKNICLEVSSELKASLSEERNIPAKLLEATNIELTFATQINKEGIVSLEKKDRVLYSYLPTGEAKYALPVLVNTSFLISANRESIHKDSKWNQWLFESISFEIFKWISELVVSEFSFDAYKLIPEETAFNDGLANAYNKGIRKAKESIAFILSRDNKLIKISEAMLDYTYLSEKSFIGEEPIKLFVANLNPNDKPMFFAKQCTSWVKLKNLGVTTFEWKDFKTFLNSPYFKQTHSVLNNIELIKLLRTCCKSEKNKDVTDEFVGKLPFIWDHKNNINYPNQVCFPSADDENWDNVENTLSFVHRDTLDWLLHDLETKIWLESLGVKEKTDITYIMQNILPHVSTYVSENNAISEVQKLFSLYCKGDLKEDLIKKLSAIKLVTTKNTLVSASKCYLSDFYSPRLKIETIFAEDIFVCKDYCNSPLDKDEWKRFFKLLGVSEGTSPQSYSNKMRKSNHDNFQLNDEYFDETCRSNPTGYSHLPINGVGSITSINYLYFTENNNKFSFEFWKDYVENFAPETVSILARGYWGYYDRIGQSSGEPVENYVPWFIRNIKCIPTCKGSTHTSLEVFLNTQELKDIAGKYLPIFSGSELSPDWKSFFNFKTTFQLEDYLNILLQISSDLASDGKLKDNNDEGIQKIYSLLLDNCENWSDSEIEKVKLWSKDNSLLNSKDTFTKCTSLHYFIDGDENVFQEQYMFLRLNAANKNHLALKRLLAFLQVNILSQSQFKLVCDSKKECNSLLNKLNSIVPYFKAWIEYNENGSNIEHKLYDLQAKISDLVVYQSRELKITYEEMSFTKNVDLHFDERTLFVTEPWNSNSVLLRLAAVLCTYFDLVGYNNELDFLLRAEINEIQKYFLRENIVISPEYLVEVNDFADEQNYDNTPKNSTNDFFEDSSHDPGKKAYIKSLIPRAVKNVLNHLGTLSGYDCTAAYVISESVIGGITKNGNEIKIVARPSDNDKIRLYYESEFDVLEYVDAELWYEDGITPPKQFTLGQLLKMQEINKIPIKQISYKDIELNNPKSEKLDFAAIPFTPEKTAQTISAFANTNGGTLLFGVKELSLTEREIVGLSTDFNVVDIVSKAISMLNPTPEVTFDWIKKGDKLVFVIETRKASQDICLNKQKYIREANLTKIESTHSIANQTINNPQTERTIAIIIAIENYARRTEDQVSDVKYAINDASSFKDMLIDSMGVNEEDIYEFKNENALKSNLEYDLKGLFYNLTEKDRLIFYYVGHGFHDGTSNYLSTFDMHPFNIATTAISLHKILLDPLKQSKCKNACIFIDACAKSFNNDYERNHLLNLNEDELKIISSEFESYSIFLSCNPGQSSYSSDILGNGIWTHFLTYSINEQVPEIILHQKYITDRKLADYLSQHVAEYAQEELGKCQTPKSILDSSYETVITEICEISSE